MPEGLSGLGWRIKVQGLDLRFTEGQGLQFRDLIFRLQSLGFNLFMTATFSKMPGGLSGLGLRM